MQIRIQKHYHTIGSQLSSMSTTVLRVRIRLDLHHFVGSGLVSTVEPAPIRISPPPLKDRPGCRKHWTNCVSGQEPGGCSSMRRSARWCMLGTTQGRHTTWTGTSWRGLRRYTHKTSGFKTSGFKTSGFKTSGFKTSGLQNVRFTKRQVSKRLISKRLVFKFDILIKQKV